MVILVDKPKGRLVAWKTKALSWADRATLVTSVLNSLLTYTMSLFKMPKKICNKMDQIMGNFWWGQN